MKDAKDKLSVIVPAYNEAGAVSALADEIAAVCRQNGLDYELIFVDDGSSDRTADIVLEKRARDARIKLIRLRRNFGKSAALAAGFKHATGGIFITMDGDLQDDPEELPRLLGRLAEGYDLVSGWKQDRRDPLAKRISSRLFNALVSKLFGLDLHDYNCGFKAYRRETAQNLEIYGGMHRFLPVLAHQQGFRVGEMPVRHRPRRHGASKYGRFGLRRYKNFLFDPLSLLLITRYLARPAHFFGNIGLAFFLIGFVICAYLSLLWLNGQPIGQRPLLFLGVLLIIVSIQLFSLGFLAEITVSGRQTNAVDRQIKEKHL